MRVKVRDISYYLKFFPKDNQVVKMVTNFTWQSKGPRITKSILKQKNKVKGLTLPDQKRFDVKLQ